ncbi:ketopantoate reductase family protein [Tenacibaculum crassostreae]|uniref:ketopantoate reductase family protein n=1 Tax=Tenacibaculum crassostreae TaxID=502683 RepID=UPI003894DBAE
MSKKNIVIVGLGGVGGYFGYKINKSNEIKQSYNITFIARGDTFKILNSKGLTLISPEFKDSITRPNQVCSNISEIEKPDLVLVCVKEYDLENVCSQLLNVITNRTIIIPMMNGANIYDRIRKIVPDNTILPSCVYVASHIKEKGIIEHKGKWGKLFFGKDPKNSYEDIEWVLDLMSDSNIDFEFRESALVDIWTKFIFIASFGLVTAKYDSSIGKVCSIPEQKEAAKDIMIEINKIALKKGIYLQSNIVEETFNKAATFPPETPTSLQLDINSNKNNNELELFGGAIIEYGKKLNIDTPKTINIYNEIKSL